LAELRAPGNVVKTVYLVMRRALAGEDYFVVSLQAGCPAPLDLRPMYRAVSRLRRAFGVPRATAPKGGGTAKEYGNPFDRVGATPPSRVMRSVLQEVRGEGTAPTQRY